MFDRLMYKEHIFDSGDRKARNRPHTARRSARHARRHISNPQTPTSPTSKRYSPHNVKQSITVGKAYYNAVQPAKDQRVHEWLTAHRVSNEEGEVFESFEVEKRAGRTTIQPASARTIFQF